MGWREGPARFRDAARALSLGLALALSACGQQTASRPNPSLPELQPEEINVVELADTFQPHWVWVNDISFTHLSDGRAYLIDADSGQFLGMVSAGYAHGMLQLSPDGRSFAVPATFYSRHTRGQRTDAVTFYAANTLAPGDEIIIPPKRMMGLPFRGAMAATDDGRFSIIYNFTPQQSVTVVDLARRRLVGEFQTAGCGLAYPTGARSFFMQCADGSLQPATLSDSGRVTLAEQPAPLFAEDDPANEHAVRVSAGDWLFFTRENRAVQVTMASGPPRIVANWSLRGAREGEWRMGGVQPTAYHPPSKRLFVLMHEGGGPFSHQDPGNEIWVFNTDTHQRVARYRLDKPATSIAVSLDANPLLYVAMFGEPDLRIFNAADGALLRSVGELGRELTVIQPSPVAAP